MTTSTQYPLFKRTSKIIKYNDVYLMLHAEKPAWVFVNEFGRDVVEYFDGKTSVADMARDIAAKYSISNAEAEQDLTAFIESIAAAGMLERDDDGPDTGNRKIDKLLLYVTGQCNLSCRHCCAWREREKQGNELSDTTVFSIVEQFESQGGTSLVLTGGEPLLRKDTVRSVVTSFPGLITTILTNGLLVDDCFLADIDRPNVRIQVSVDGAGSAVHDSIRGPGSYEKVSRALASIQRTGFQARTTLCTTVMQQNCNELKEILQLADSLGIPNVRFIPLRQEGEACRNWGQISSNDTGVFENFNDYVCHAASAEFPGIAITTGVSGILISSREMNTFGHWCPIGNLLIVDCSGDMYPCVMFMDEKYTLGNVRHNSLREICNSSKMEELVGIVDERKNKIASCRECDWQHFCQGGCAGMALNAAGTVWSTDGYCSIRKKMYQNIFEKLSSGRKPSLPGRNETCD